MSAKHSAALIVGALILVHPSAARAQAAPAKSAPAQGAKAAPADAQYEQLFNHYLEAARKMGPPPGLWIADLMNDPRARRLNDLVTIRIEENISASGNADASMEKTTDAKGTAGGKIGTALSKVLPVDTDTKFSGGGTTTRGSQVSAFLTARVSEVLPNGDLVVEGVREVDVNNDRQIVVLTGVIRAVDIAQGNVISSTLIGQMQIRSIGQGMIKDSLTPGWLVRILNKIF